MKISVIIPVYNAEKYLETALLSVINQTLTDIEIILVNDGSTDGSRAIIEKYAAIDRRIVVVNKENQGVALARADGVAISKGDYIQTMDNDDYMYPYALEKLYNRAIETDADMVVGRSLFYTVADGVEVPDFRVDFDVITGLELFSLICRRKACWATWTRLHKATIYRDKDIKVLKNINRSEDVYLTSQLCYYAKKVVTIDDYIIKWFIRPSSLSNSRRMNDAEADEFSVMSSLLTEFFYSKGVIEKVKKDILLLDIRSMQELIMKGYTKNSYRDCMKIARMAKNDPEIEGILFPRTKRIIKAYRYFGKLGYARIILYKLRGKI